MSEILGKTRNTVFFFNLFFERILVVLGCIDFTISLSKSLMWHVLIGWCKLKGLHTVLIEFNIFQKRNLFQNVFCFQDKPFFLSVLKKSKSKSKNKIKIIIKKVRRVFTENLFFLTIFIIFFFL